ncbi:ABC transporter family substrate-binding protein [Cutibacterium sp. WCA-380-WT-3A]|uniref:ABC transporter family substrate-binding protein n=1 Tax=Cutibacterium porci TaxID=2605781 RepID=A0A7K0J818_9ACTN|nr:ABC transporter family substrate-binding protein [Cutibacterium porci]MSS46095.1 ABC transporter family substrate-binding protein [Cutibacterium porci]
MRKAIMTSVTVLAVSALALTGCGQKNQSGGSKQSGLTSESAPLAQLNVVDRGQLKDGGTLRLAIEQLPTGWNPMNVNGNTTDLSTTIWQFVGANNFDITEDGTPKPNPNYISSTDVETKGGKQVVTLHLNPKAKWNSGRTIDYTDYQATWKANNGSDPGFLPASTDGFNQISSVEKGDKDTDVVLTFKTTYPDWPATLSTVLPKEGVKNAQTFNEGWNKLNPDWFTGPFIPTKADEASKTLTVKRNDKWWGEKSKLDIVTFKAMNNATQTKAFANKEIDAASNIITKDGYQTAAKRPDAQMRQAGSLQWRHFTFNTKSTMLSDKKVRQAIAKGINRPAIAKSDLAGMPVNPDTLMLGNHFFMPGQAGYKDNSTDYKYDPEAAKKGLDEAGWKMQGDYRVKGGKTLTINYAQLTGVPTSENEGALFKQDMAKIGVKVDLVNTPSDSFTQTLSSHSFDVIAFAWNGTPYPMANVRQIYGAAAVGSTQPSQSNFSQLIDPEIEKLIPKIDTESDISKRRELANQADAMIWDDVMTLPLYRRISFTAVPKNLANFGAATFQTMHAEDIGFQK